MTILTLYSRNYSSLHRRKRKIHSKYRRMWELPLPFFRCFLLTSSPESWLVRNAYWNVGCQESKSMWHDGCLSTAKILIELKVGDFKEYVALWLHLNHVLTQALGPWTLASSRMVKHNNHFLRFFNNMRPNSINFMIIVMIWCWRYWDFLRLDWRLMKQVVGVNSCEYCHVSRPLRSAHENGDTWPKLLISFLRTSIFMKFNSSIAHHDIKVAQVARSYECYTTHQYHPLRIL